LEDFLLRPRNPKKPDARLKNNLLDPEDRVSRTDENGGFFFGEKILFTLRVARFFLEQHTKMGKKYIKSPQNIPNGHKIFPMAETDQMVIKYTNIFH
jgi:hypothetical protein